MSQPTGPSLPHKKSCIFYKLMVASILHDKKLKIPNKFVKKFGHELSSIATLNVPSGRLWLVELRKENKRVWLDCGWTVFVEYYSICSDHDRKKRKNSTFLDQKNDVDDLRVTVQSTRDKGIQFNGVELTSAADEGGLNFLNGTQKNTKEIKQEIEPDEYKSLGKFIVKEELPAMNSPRSDDKKRRDATAEGKQIALRAAAMFKPDNPFCRVILRPSYVYKGIFLHIPRCFALRYLNGVDGIVTLQVSEGKKWPVRCIYGQSSWKFSKGWAEFVLDNNLDEGDVCVFELISTKEIVLKVTIFRVLEDGVAVN
ncbi:hypothetical protein ES319_A13G039300v1 [Gossypium barbadense]|uniref:TF-B3 domain-containing protein n=3 Tax=Gossypium TaxID=3633 RepID=A0A5J5SUP5_GOSBA|nr:hypothetical protein ES319_A13G039300v1 [Gossypium barbadense]TYG85245.1 hypothetical protein ES288_A13G037900v1 [Gossypium darwinii]TYH90311.1 hypothetical protein ES332_A13G041000v1 [Gossypium tomentosum]